MPAVTTEMVVFPENDIHGILSQYATRIKIQDEGGGCFLELEQEGNTIRIDFSEWDQLINAVQYIRAQYEMQGLL